MLRLRELKQLIINPNSWDDKTDAEVRSMFEDNIFFLKGTTGCNVPPDLYFRSVMCLLCEKRDCPIRYIRILDQVDPALKYSHVKWEQYPIHLAAANCRDDIVQLLVNGDPSQVDLKDDNGDTPMVQCVQSEYGKKTLIVLIEEGSRALHDLTTPGRNHPMRIAAKAGHLDLVMIMARYCPTAVDVCAPFINVFSQLIEKKRLNDIKELVGLGCTSYKTTQYSPFNVAIESENEEIIQYFFDLLGDTSELIQRCKEGKNRKTTPLHVAARTGNLNVVKLVFPKVNQFIHIPDELGNLPLHVALLGGHVEIAMFLLENDTANTHLCVDTFHQTVMMSAAKCKNAFPLMDMLLRLNNKSKNTWATINTQAVQPLHCAVSVGDHENVKYLIKRGVDVDPQPPKRKGFHRSPLSLAIEDNRLDIAFTLLRKGASMNVRDNGTKQKSLLDHACCKRNVETLRFLYLHGHDFQLPCEVGKPLALEFAMDSGSIGRHLDFARLCFQLGVPSPEIIPAYLNTFYEREGIWCRTVCFFAAHMNQKQLLPNSKLQDYDEDYVHEQRYQTYFAGSLAVRLVFELDRFDCMASINVQTKKPAQRRIRKREN